MKWDLIYWSLESNRDTEWLKPGVIDFYFNHDWYDNLRLATYFLWCRATSRLPASLVSLSSGKFIAFFIKETIQYQYLNRYSSISICSSSWDIGFTIKSYIPSVGDYLWLWWFSGTLLQTIAGNDEWSGSTRYDCYLFLCDLGIALMVVRNRLGIRCSLQRWLLQYSEHEFLVFEHRSGRIIYSTCNIHLRPKCEDSQYLGAYIFGIIIDHYIFSMTTKLKNILSKKNDEICRPLSMNSQWGARYGIWWFYWR